MEKPQFILSLGDAPVPEFEAGLPPSEAHGADLRFHGVVRGREDGRPVSGIDYSAYRPMADRELERIAEEMAAESPGHLAAVHHRLGFVAAGEASLLIRVQAPRSAEAFALCQEYLRRIKAGVPVWKRPVFTS